MAAHSDVHGHPVHWRRGHWRYDDTRHSVRVERPRPCRLCGHAVAVVELVIPARWSSTGEDKLKMVQVDACIAGLVMALNGGGILTVASCCGHGRRPGNIILADGRELFIAPDYETARKLDKCWPPINEEIK